MNKIPNRTTKELQKKHSKNQDAAKNENAKFDKIKMYLDCRYILACEAYWHIYQFKIHHMEPIVERLPFHLPDKHQVYLKRLL